MKIFKRFAKEEKKDTKTVAKERLHLVLMQDRANVSADFMELMKQEIIEVIKKYIDVDENSIDVKLTNKVNSDGTTGAPILYANIPILNVKDDTKQISTERNLEKEEINKKGAKKEQLNKKENKEKQTNDVKKNKKIKKTEKVENKTESEEIVEENKTQEPGDKKEIDEIAFKEEAFENSEVEGSKKEETKVENNAKEE